MSLSNQWGHTEIRIEEYDYTWTIINFSYLDAKVGERLESPGITMDKESKLKCKILLYPMGDTETSKDYLSLYLDCQLEDKSTYNIHYELSILNNKNDKIYKYFVKRKFSSSESYGWPEFLKRKILEGNKSKLLAGDSLVIHCNMKIFKEFVQKTGTNNILKQPVEEPFLKKLFLDERFSDVKLVAPCGKELSSHKIVLVACSPVFAAMFEHDMLEREQNVVKIDDIQYDVLKEMLKYVYGAELECDTEMLSKLLTAADKYQIEGLKNKCVYLLAKGTTVHNVIEILVVADRHSINHLKILALNFIKEHIGVVVRSTDLNSITQAHVLADIVRLMAS